MKIEVFKQAGGIFTPVDDTEYEKTTKFKTGEQYQVEIKLTRNPKFHKKVFVFFNFCFSYWSGVKSFMDESAQKDEFRKQLTILAGYYNECYNLQGNLIIRAESLSFGSMSEERFREVYSALINTALVHIFADCRDANIENQLVGFFS
jgi:hypothetical protein